MDTLPSLVSELIRQLDEIYPKPTIIPGADLDKLLYQAGQRSVIDRLISLQN